MESDILVQILDRREKPKNLPFALFKNITDNFSEGRIIDEGGFAIVYKGVFPNGSVAVKRIRSKFTIDEKLFYRELNSLLTVNHTNVVRFLGFCASTEQAAEKIEGSRLHLYYEIRERLLCLEYISNGNLKRHITDELRGLEWNTRYQIIKGICEGLHYLHKEKHIYHMDLKPANILLDDYMVPKITDFGLSRLDEKSQSLSENHCGTRIYCAPEYLKSGKMSFKSDMFSLGIIITELVTGEKGISVNDKNNVLRRWRHRWKKTGKETPLAYQQVAKCMEIGLLCQENIPSKRPFIWDVIHDIRQMEGVNGTVSNASEYTFGQICPYSEDDMLGVEPLELHFPFELTKEISCSLKLTNQTDAFIAFYVEKMSPLSYYTQPNKEIVPPKSKCSVHITLQAQDKAPRDMQRCGEFIVWSIKVNEGLAAKDIAINMFSTESGVVDAMNLDVVFDAEESTKISKALIVHSITEEMSKNEIDGTFGEQNKSQDCLLPTHLWTSSTSSRIQQEAAKECNELHRASNKNSECTDKLLVLNSIGSKDLTPQSVTREMSINKTDGKVADHTKFYESFPPMPTLLELSASKQNYQKGPQALNEPQSAPDKTTETKCTDKLLVLNSIGSKDLTPQSVTGEMSINKTDGKVADHTKFYESFPPMPTLLELRANNQNYQKGPQAFNEPQSAPDRTCTETEVIPDSSGLLDVQPLELRFRFEPKKLIACSLDLTNNTNEQVVFRLVKKRPEQTCFLRDLPLFGIVDPGAIYTLALIMDKHDDLPKERNVDLILETTIYSGILSKGDNFRGKCIQHFRNAEDSGNTVQKVTLKSGCALRGEMIFESIPPSIKILSMEDNMPCVGVTCMDANQTEQLIIIGYFSGNVRIWNYDTQKSMGSIELPARETALCVRFIARKGWCLVGSEEGFIHVYDYKKELQKTAGFKADKGMVSSLAIHPTQPYVLSAYSEGIKLWDWHHGWKHMQTFKEGSRSIRAVAFKPEDHNSFASASYDGTIKVLRSLFFL